MQPRSLIILELAFRWRASMEALPVRPATPEATFQLLWHLQNAWIAIKRILTADNSYPRLLYAIAMPATPFKDSSPQPSESRSTLPPDFR
jgi:hypothetical protein